MKHNIAPEPDRIVDLVIEHPPFLEQDTPFTITNLAVEQATAIQESVEADFATQAVKRTTRARKPATGAPEAPQVVYTEPTVRDKARQYFADAHVRRFDKAHGSNLYGELLAQRRRDALFLKASQIGLLGQDSMFYKRKLGALTKPVVD